MNLTSDWRRVARYAWSLRLAALAGAFSAAEIVLPLFVDAMPRGVFAGLSLLSAVGGAVARVVAQPRMERRAAPRQKHDGAREEFND
jgi:hypothetical protein